MQGELAVKERALSREEALEVAARCAEVLKARFGATRVIVFGSAAGQAPWHEGSDLDLAVEGLAADKYWEALRALREVLPHNLEVDLVKLETAYSEMHARILGEVEMPDDPILALKSLVTDELKTLERIVSDVNDYAEQAHDLPTSMEMDAMALKVHQFYSGIESIFERIAVQFDGGVPKTGRWHADLLYQMSQAREDVRPAVIDDKLWLSLDDYREFRHFVRHGYGEDFEWHQLRLKVERMPETFDLLRAQLDQFFAALRPAEPEP